MGVGTTEMPDYLEAWRPGPELVPLASERITIGQETSNDLVITSDGTVSRLHAVIERFSSGWCIRDLGSRNGTWVNGERVFGERVLHADDEIRVGKTRLVLREERKPEVPGARVTEVVAPAPPLTARERDVLLTLCAPLLEGNLFTEPASVREVAERLVVTETAVRQHLLRMYEKFDIPDSGERRRVLLANEAISRGAVTVGDLRK